MCGNLTAAFGRTAQNKNDAKKVTATCSEAGDSQATVKVQCTAKLRATKAM